MKRQSNYFILFILLSGVIFSCETTEKIDDFPLRPSKLVVNSFLNPDTIWQFQISKSLSVLDNADLKFIDSATINLFEENELITTLTTPDPDGWFRYHGHYPEAGKTYSISVTAPKFQETLQATETVPAFIRPTETNVLIKDSSFYSWTDHNGHLIQSGHAEGTFEITFSDPAETENFYELSIFFLDSIYDYEDSTAYEINSRSLYITSDDGAVEDGTDGGTVLLIKDEYINGQQYTLKVDFEDHQASINKIYIIELKSLSKNTYLYRRSNRAYRSAVNDPFAEPVQVFCNITNGYGIFAGYATSYGFVELK